MEAVVALLHAGANPRLHTEFIASMVWAAQAGADTVIGMLVRAGAYINASDVNGRTALHWAAHPDLQLSINGFSVAVELLRHADHILNWEMQDVEGDTASDYAQRRVRRNHSDEDSKRILELCRTRQLPEDAQYLPTPSIVETADESVTNNTMGLPSTSLIRAALNGNIDAVGDLIQRGAMVNERDYGGRTVLHLVALGRVPEGYLISLELVRYGGWGLNWDALTGDDGNCTALKIAQTRIEQEQLSQEEREELQKVRDLLKTKRLPPGEEYLWPCMDPDFYSVVHEPCVPGAWSDD